MRYRLRLPGSHWPDCGLIVRPHPHHVVLREVAGAENTLDMGSWVGGPALKNRGGRSNLKWD